MIKDVDEGVALVGFVERRPIGNTLHSMLIKQLDGVIAEAREQIG